MKWLRYSLFAFVLFFEALSASAIATPKKNPERPPPEENPRNYFGYFEASYTYWVGRRESLGIFIPNYYSTPTPTPVQGNVAYAPSPAQSGFKVAAGFQSLEREILFMLKYTWFNNNAPIASFSYPGSTGYLASSPEFTTTSGGTAQIQTNYQRVDFLLLNCLPNFLKYLVFQPFFDLVLAWDHETTNIVSENSGGATTSTLNQRWWSFGPELGLNMSYALYKTTNHQMYIHTLMGAGSGWSGTTTTALNSVNATGNTTLSSFDSVYAPTIVIDIQFGFKYSHKNLEKQKAFFDCHLSWDFQTWINNFSVFNGSLWSLQGLTAGFGCTF